MTDEKNEFENLDMDENNLGGDFSGADDVPTTSGESTTSNAASGGALIDLDNLPDETKAPERIDLDGKEVIIDNAELRNPRDNDNWVTARNNAQVKYKGCRFTLFYNLEKQQESISGVRVFQRDNGQMSPPAIGKDRKTQASNLMGLYADYKGKDINEVSLKEFFAFLRSKPKAIIKVTDVENPTNNKIVKKNLIGKFI